MLCLPYLSRTPMKELGLSYSLFVFLAPRTKPVKSKVLKTFYIELMILILFK